MASFYKKLDLSQRKLYQNTNRNWQKVLEDEEYAINLVLDKNLIKNVRCNRSGCKKFKKLMKIGNSVIMRCPNYQCFKKDKENKIWCRPKLINFEDFRLNIGEILYLLLYGFLNKFSYQRVLDDTKIGSQTYFKLKKKIREIIASYNESSEKLGEQVKS